MTHSTEAELRGLLFADTDEVVDPTVAEHVEQCARCQMRLEKLSGAGELTSAMVAHLRTLEEGERELRDRPPQTTIELRVASLQDDAPESDEIELEPVALDFLEPAAHPELLGRLGRFDIERVIGTGGMGVVFKAHDGELHRSVAVKVLAPHLANSVAARKRFAREAQAAAAVIHPNVIPIHNVDSDGKLPYLVMQYVAGESLQTRVDRLGPLPITDVLRIAQQTAAGLSAAHTQGLIHRDVKPANILLEESIDRVVLSDFGLARTVDDATLTRTGIVAGTPHYMSPEQASGEAIDCRSDLFSLGCVMYFMLTGRPPFRAESAMGVLNRICHHPHRPLSQVNAGVPRELARVVDRLLSKSAAGRFQSATECESELAKLLAALQSGRLRIARPRPSLTKSTVWPLALSCTLSLAAGAALVSLWSNRDRDAKDDDRGERVVVQEQVFAGPSGPQPASGFVGPNILQGPASPVGPAMPPSVNSTGDPAIVIWQNMASASQEGRWNESMRELAEQLQRFEKRDAESAAQQLDWLQSQSAAEQSALKQINEELERLQESLSKLPLPQAIEP